MKPYGRCWTSVQPSPSASWRPSKPFPSEALPLEKDPAHPGADGHPSPCVPPAAVLCSFADLAKEPCPLMKAYRCIDSFRHKDDDGRFTDLLASLYTDLARGKRKSPPCTSR